MSHWLEERDILELLDNAVKLPAVRSAIDEAVARIQDWLTQHPAELFGWQTIPVSLFENLPPVIRSAWIFVIQPDLPPEKHRHPNSHQFTASYQGNGDLQTWHEDGWQANYLQSELSEPAPKRWVSIPPGTWHRPIVSAYWTVVSFHTATESELIEETESAGRGAVLRSYADH